MNWSIIIKLGSENCHEGGRLLKVGTAGTVNFFGKFHEINYFTALLLLIKSEC